MKQIGIGIAVWIYEKVTEASLIWACAADFVVQVGVKRNAGSARGNDMFAVAAKVAVVAEVDPGVRALFNVGGWCCEGEAGAKSR